MLSRTSTSRRDQQERHGEIEASPPSVINGRIDAGLPSLCSKLVGNLLSKTAATLRDTQHGMVVNEGLGSTLHTKF
jgi:hypothetical protein